MARRIVDAGNWAGYESAAAVDDAPPKTSYREYYSGLHKDVRKLSKHWLQQTFQLFRLDDDGILLLPRTDSSGKTSLYKSDTLIDLINYSFMNDLFARPLHHPDFVAFLKSNNSMYPEWTSIDWIQYTDE